MVKSSNCSRDAVLLSFLFFIGIIYLLLVMRQSRVFLWPQISCFVNGPTFKVSTASRSLDPRGAPANACQMRHTDFHEADFPRFTWPNSGKKVERSSHGKELLLQLYHNQFCHPRRCKERTLDLPSRIDGQGVGHRIIQEAHSLLTAMGLDRIFRVALGGWKYCDKATCSAESSVCYFEPAHGCMNVTTSDALKERNLLLDLFVNYIGKPQNHLFLYGNYHFKDSLTPCLKSPKPSGWEQNRFYHSAIATYFMSQPQQWLLDEVESARRSLGLTKEYIAMHVRHGDKWKNVELFNFSNYMNIVIKNFPKLTTILIMTSDQKVIDDTAQYPDYRFVWTDYPRFYGTRAECQTTDAQKLKKYGCKDLHIPDLIKTGELNGHKEMVNAMVNFYLAVDSSGFICTLSSNFPRSILRFRLGAYDNLMPVWSLQDWSYDIGITQMPNDLRNHINFVPPLPDPFDLSKISLADSLTGF